MVRNTQQNTGQTSLSVEHGQKLMVRLAKVSQDSLCYAISLEQGKCAGIYNVKCCR